MDVYTRSPGQGELVKVRTHVVAVAVKKSLHFLDRVDLVSHVSSSEKVVLPNASTAVPSVVRQERPDSRNGLANIDLLLERYFRSGRYKLFSASI
jgi:hypothetical protein